MTNINTVREYLENKINNSWFANAKLDYGIDGHFISAIEDLENLIITWFEDGNYYEITIAYYKDFTAEQIYNIWMEEGNTAVA